MEQTDGMLYIISDQESAGTPSAWDRVLQPGNKKIRLIAGEPESKRVKALRFRLCCFSAFTGRQQEVDCGRPP